MVEEPARQLVEFASGAWSRLTSFVGGLVRRVLSGDFGLPSLSEMIGQLSPADLRAGGPITKPRPGPITLPGLRDILLVIAIAGALVVAAFPQLAVVVAALLALGLTRPRPTSSSGSPRSSPSSSCCSCSTCSTGC